MVCPFCLHEKTQVYNSRPTKRLHILWRRRRCLQCKNTFTTREVIDLQGIIKVQQTTNKVVDYSPITLLLSILNVCDHREQKEVAYWLCSTIEQLLLALAAKQQGIITKDQIIEKTLVVLKRFDAATFVKYLSYHAPFLTARELKKKLKD